MTMMIDWLAANCKQNLLAEKWLLADSRRIAQQWKDQLNLAGHSSINLNAKTIRSLAISLTGELLAAKNISFASYARVRMLVHSIVSQMMAKNQLEYFGAVNSIDGLSDLLGKSIQDLRLAEVAPSQLAESNFESAAKARDLIRVYQAFCDELHRSCTTDYAGCLDLVTRGVSDGSIKLPSGLLVLLPEELNRLTKAESKLFDAIAKISSPLRPDSERFNVQSSRRRIIDRLSAKETQFDFFAGLGEVNEVRGVVQQVMSGKSNCSLRFDNVEILHTDYQHYVPLILELFSTWMASNHSDESKLPSVDTLPLTFAEGIACIYSRPGRALRSWLRWARADFVQTKAVQLIREGLLVRPPNAEDIGFSRLANSLRRIPIGFKSERYLEKLTEAIESAKHCKMEHDRVGDKDPGDSQVDDRDNRDFGLSTLEAVLAMMKPLVNLAPRNDNNAVTILEKARGFLLQCVRSESKLDRFARAKLLDDINGMLVTLHSAQDSNFDVLQWLEDLPMESCVFDSGPLPGCIHIAPIDQGGHSGRKEIYMVGLDDARFPRRCSVDPILLDGESNRISEELESSENRSQRQQQALDRVLFRILENHGSKVSFSYSVRSLGDDRHCFPSSSMLEMFRLSKGQEDVKMDDLLSEIGRPVSFVSESRDEHLSISDSDVAGILLERNESQRQRMLEEMHEHTAYCRAALESRKANELGAYDGLVPQAGNDLNPAADKPISASKLETYGTCPRKFFFSRGLGIYPPEEWEVDPDSWLNSMQFGNLVHELFEDFLRGHTAKGLTPILTRDREPLIQLLDSKIDALKMTIPTPNVEAFVSQRNLLMDLCEIFLDKEEVYCRENNAVPWVLESSVGTKGESKTELDSEEPVALTLSDGRVLRLTGRIDRVDKLLTSGSERYVIWDYKSSSSFGFSQENPFNQGRKLQSFLYVGMLRHRIAATGGNADAVDSFGYFFPNPKTEGLRLRWTRGELKGGDEIVRNICDAITAGVFVATTKEEDCKFCDYLAVCGDPTFVAAESLRKVSHPANEAMRPFRLLRDIDVVTGGAK